jgi:hypothetical protein
MIHLSSLRNRFLRDNIATQFGNLAANLARIHSYSKESRHNEIVAHLLDESRFFVEWLALNASLEQQLVLVDLQRVLTRWHFTWPQLSINLAQRESMRKQVQAWSEKVLDMSGLLIEPIPENEKVYA